MEKLKQLWSRYFSSINTITRAGLGLLVVFLFAAGYYFEDKSELLQRLEHQAYDIRLRATMPEKPDSRVVVIDIDEKSLAAEGRWPWSRDKLSLLIEQLYDKYKIKVVAWDVMFTEPDNSSGLGTLENLGSSALKNNQEFQEQLKAIRPTLDYDARFAESLKKYPVVMAFAGTADPKQNFKLGTLPTPTFELKTQAKLFPSREISGYSGNIAQIQDAGAATGHIVPEVDLDGVIRRIPAFIRMNGAYYESLSIATYRTFLDNEVLKIVPRDDEGDKIPKIKEIAIRDSRIPLDEYGMMLIPYRGYSPMFRYIPATDIIQGKLTPGELAGKIGFVGTSAQGLLDLRNTPVGGIYPGVETHANMVSGFLDNTLKRAPEFEFTIKVLIVLVLGIPLALALVKLSPIASTLAVLISSLVYAAINFFWWQKGYVLPLAIPLLTILSLFVLNMAYGFFVEARSKRAITGIFGTYVPKELVAEMAENPGAYTTKGETRDMTVLFSDVRNFTTISEGLSATELTAMMNAYLTHMTETIQKERGTIDKYIGDMIMAFWGAPLKDENHAEHALHSALAMQKQLKEIAPDFIKRGWPKLEIGIGLNCGPMNVGDMGSTFRRAYTVLGDAVNLGSRLEALTKGYGVGILVSEHIVNRVGSVVYREIDRVRVKGKTEPISIYEPVGLRGEVPESVAGDVDRFHKALDRFRAQRWDDAQTILQALYAAEPTRKVYKLYIERIDVMRQEPPGKDWDGVYTHTSKG